ncbi:MAG TPA: hypothetical protein VF478_12240, partial [Anaerolineae bacterium]
LQLSGSGAAVANRDGVPSRGRVTTDGWKPGQTFVSHHTLIVPNDLPSGSYTLRLGLHPFGRWDWLTVNRRDMLDLATIQVN